MTVRELNASLEEQLAEPGRFVFEGEEACFDFLEPVELVEQLVGVLHERSQPSHAPAWQVISAPRRALLTEREAMRQAASIPAVHTEVVVTMGGVSSGITIRMEAIPTLGRTATERGLREPTAKGRILSEVASRPRQVASCRQLWGALSTVMCKNTLFGGLASLKREGKLETLSRGVYRLNAAPPDLRAQAPRSRVRDGRRR